MGNFYIVATPIGNLSDMTFRAVDALKSVDLILCEDTRKTKILLDHYQIKTPVMSYHQHTKLEKVNHILDMLKQGKNLALVSDAGTPGISDPGNLLIKEIFLDIGEAVKIIPIPGVSAVAAAVSVSGFPTDKFLFLGFPPVKKNKKRFLREIMDSEYPVVFYESPYRIMKILGELAIMNDKLDVVVCRELTKKFETIYRGTAKEMPDKIKKDEIRGEFVVIAEGRKQKRELL
jgi:16S rRNA (cytidine1402-2'-O)-methyltransferase